MKRYYFSVAILLFLTALVACSASPATDSLPSTQTAITSPSKPPNIILIIADDLGVDSSPCYEISAEKPNMPNLEAICQTGVVFDNVWATPACSSTRAAILTGQYGFRTGVLAAGETLQDTRSIYDVLANEVPVSYPNAVIGKWHVGGHRPDSNHPAQFGVEHYAGFMTSGLKNYYEWEIIEDGVTSSVNEYATTVLTDKSIEWVSQQDQPFFLWLAYNAPHGPNHLPPADLHTNNALTGTPKDIRNNPRAYYFAALEALDTEMGRLLDSLSPEVRANTVVIFIGDNGPYGDVAQAPFDPERSKFTIYEGGVRVPMIVSGYGVTRAGQREDALINITDLFSTIAELAGNPNLQTKDSVSFAQALTDPTFAGRAHALTEYRHEDGITAWAARNAQYKLIEYSDGRMELYDLIADPFESNNLIASGISSELQKVVAELQNYRGGL